MKDHITLGHVLPCACGDDQAPCTGWMGPPITHYVHCPACGEWVTGDNEDEAAAAWNLTARKAKVK